MYEWKIHNFYKSCYSTHWWEYKLNVTNNETEKIMSFTDEDITTALNIARADPTSDNISRIASICAEGYGSCEPDSEAALAWYIVAAHVGSKNLSEIQTGLRRTGGADKGPMSEQQKVHAQALACEFKRNLFEGNKAKETA